VAGDRPDEVVTDMPPAAVDREARARALLAQLSTTEKLSLRDASHGHPWPAGQLPRLGLRGLHFVDGPRGVLLQGSASTLERPAERAIEATVELRQQPMGQPF